MSCGLFNVNSTVFENLEYPNDCVVVLILTVGGTGIPLTLVILLLLCCTVIRHRKRSRSVDITKVEEGQGVVEVQLTDVDIPRTDDLQERLYDSVDELSRPPACPAVTASDVKKACQEASPELEKEPQPYEEVVHTEQPVYAKPDKKRKLNGAAKVSGIEAKRASMPLLEQYSSLFDSDKTDPPDPSNRSLDPLPPEALYSSIGDITSGPPLPPPLAPEDIPESIPPEESASTTAATIGLDSTDQRGHFYTNVAQTSPLDSNAPGFSQSLSEPVHTAAEKIGSIDATDQMSRYYTNVTLASPLASEIENLLNFGQPQEEPANTAERVGRIDAEDQDSPFYTNVTLTHKPVHQLHTEAHSYGENMNSELSESGHKTYLEDEPEITQDLYMNV